MAWQGFRPVCRIRTPAAGTLPGLFALMRWLGEQMAVTDRHIWRGFCSGIQFLLGFSGHIIG